MINKNIAFAVIALVTGLAGATVTHAGQATVMLGSTGFANRCTDNGGQLLGNKDGYACQLPTTMLECTFAGANAECEWNGGQLKREVTRVIGMVVTESLASPGVGGAKAKKVYNGPLCGGYPC